MTVDPNRSVLDLAASQTRGARAAGNTRFSQYLETAERETATSNRRAPIASAASTRSTQTVATDQGSTTPSGTTRADQTAKPAGNPFLPNGGVTTTTNKPATAAPAPSTLWSPWDGPKDFRDEIPAGGGQVTTKGSPAIVPNSTAAKNQYNYAGPAAYNPYFTTPSNPLRDGYVVGFGNWFTQNFVNGGKSGPVPTNKIFNSTEDGAKEALRLVQQYEPGAEIVNEPWAGGPFSMSAPMYHIKLPNGKLMNAGGILDSYYNGGCGVTAQSDELLMRSIAV